MSQNSPWGSVQHVTAFERGVSFISTARHGGLRVSEGYAKKNLSTSALSRAIKQGAYYFYEEDCNIFIAMWELPHLWHFMWRDLNMKEILWQRKLLKSQSV